MKLVLMIEVRDTKEVRVHHCQCSIILLSMLTVLVTFPAEHVPAFSAAGPRQPRIPDDWKSQRLFQGLLLIGCMSHLCCVRSSCLDEHHTTVCHLALELFTCADVVLSLSPAQEIAMREEYVEVCLIDCCP